MKPFIKKVLAIAITLYMIMLLTACGELHTCTRCGREFRGNTYQGVLRGSVMHRSCAREYWFPVDYRLARIR